MMRWLLFLLSLLFSCSFLAVQATAQVDGVGRITYDQLVIPISVQSPDNNLEVVAKQAFRLHGGFKMIQESGAKYAIRISRRAGSTVLLTIVPLRGDGSTESFPVSGKDIRMAVLLACDMAVERLTKEPGFFAGQMAYVNHSGKIRELYSSDLFFQGFQKLTSHRYQVISPDWSPDGSKILYSSNHKGGLDIYMLDVASRVPLVVASFKGQNHGAVFDPHGRRAAMILNREVFIHSSILNPNVEPTRVTHNPSAETSPTWSPSGREMIVSSDIQGGAKLYEVILTGSNKGRMRPLPINVSRECTEPAWNPHNSNLLAFTANINGHSQIAVFNFQTNETKVIQSNSDDEGASWTNDGRHLVYSSQQGGAHQLKILDTVTEKQVALHTRTSGNFSSPDFHYPLIRN